MNASKHDKNLLRRDKNSESSYYRHENKYGGFAEFTANSVWSKPKLATAEPIYDKVSDYVADPALDEGAKVKDRKKDVDFFKPGLREYFHNRGAGHYRMDVSDDSVTMAFYPGDARKPARQFRLV